MKSQLLISLLTSIFCSSLAAASPFARYDNEATKALTAEAAAIDSPQRVSVGDNPANAVYWTGEQAIPAERVADLLQLSMANGYTTADQWFTNPSGSVIVFMSEPGCGAANHVFTVFKKDKQKDGDAYKKVGTYNFITRYLTFCPKDVQVDNWNLTVVYTTKNGNLRIEKNFYFYDNPQETCRAYDAPEEKEDLGKDKYLSKRPLRMHVNGLDSKQPICHRIGRNLREIDSIDFSSLRDFLWSVVLDERGNALLNESEVSEDLLHMLYATHRYNSAWSGWMADEQGNTLVLIEEHASGCMNYTLSIYRRSATNPKSFEKKGCVAVGSRYLDWNIAATRFEEDGLYIELGGNGYKERKSGKILYDNPQNFLYRITPGDEPQ